MNDDAATTREKLFRRALKSLIYRAGPTHKKWKREKPKSKKLVCSEVSVNSPRGIGGVSPEEEKEGCGGKD